MADQTGMFGLDPEALNQLLAQFQPSEEDKRRARTSALASAGFGILGAQGVNGMQAIGRGGLLGVQSYNNDLKDYQAQRMQNLQAVASLSNLMQQQRLSQGAMDFANGGDSGPQAATQGPPAMAASQNVGGSGMGGGSPGLFGPSSGGLPPSAQTAGPPPTPQKVDWRQLAPKGAAQLAAIAAMRGDTKPLIELSEKYSGFTMGPDGTVLDSQGTPQYKMTPAGVQRFGPGGTPGGFEPFPQAATDAAAAQAGASAKATAAGTKQGELPYTLVSVPDGRGGTIQMPASQAVPMLSDRSAAMLTQPKGMGGSAASAFGDFGTTPTPAQTAQDTDIAKAQGADYASIQSAARQAPRNIQNIDMLRNLLSNVDTGSTQPISDKFKATVASVFPALAKSWAKDVPYSQAAQSLIAQMQLDLRANMGNLRLTPEDQSNLQNLLALPTNDPRAIPMILDARRANEVTNQKIGDLAFKYKLGNRNMFDEGFNPVQADYLTKNPIFPQSAQQPAGAAPAKAAPTRTIPADGTKSTTKDGRPVIVKNGQWRLQ